MNSLPKIDVILTDERKKYHLHRLLQIPFIAEVIESYDSLPKRIHIPLTRVQLDEVLQGKKMFDEEQYLSKRRDEN